MTKETPMSLRTHLRIDTNAAHEIPDGLMSQLDLTTRNGFVRFLRIEVKALAAMRPHPQTAASYDALCDLAQRAASDLARFETPPSAQRPIKSPSSAWRGS